MTFPQFPFGCPDLGRALHGYSGLFLFWLIGITPLQAQVMKGASDGFFDRIEVGSKLPLEIGKLQSPVAWKNFWQRAARRGPLCESALEKEFATQHGLQNRLALLCGFSLAGGERAAKYLEEWYRGGRKIPEELVFLCLGSSAGNLPLRLSFLQHLSQSKKNPTVVRLAAAIARIQRTQPRVSPDIGELFAEQPEGLFVRLLRDQLQVPPSFGPDARAWVFKGIPFVGTKPRPAGGFDHLAKTLAFLNLAATPNALGKKQTLDLLARETQYQEILSLILGRQRGKGTLKDLQANGLSLPHFLAGIQEADPTLQKRILEGPGGARGAGYNELWWAAGARLVTMDRMASFCKKCSSEPFGQKGLQVLLWRVLVGGVKPPSVEAFMGGKPSAGREILLYLQSRDPKFLKGLRSSIHPKVLYALQQLYPPELEATPKRAPVPRENGVILWNLLAKDWAPRGALPGTEKRLRLQLLSKWVESLFIGGSSYARSQLGLSNPGSGYLPKGIRGNKQTYFRILSLFLKEYPFFGV